MPTFSDSKTTESTKIINVHIKVLSFICSKIGSGSHQYLRGLVRGHSISHTDTHV